VHVHLELGNVKTLNPINMIFFFNGIICFVSSFVSLFLSRRDLKFWVSSSFAGVRLRITFNTEFYEKTKKKRTKVVYCWKNY
jgi:hypothetical protein